MENSLLKLLEYRKGTVIKNIRTGAEVTLSGELGISTLDDDEVPTIYDKVNKDIICFIRTDEWAEIVSQPAYP